MLLEETASKLGHVTDDKDKYKSVLEGLITQVLFDLLPILLGTRGTCDCKCTYPLKCKKCSMNK